LICTRQGSNLQPYDPKSLKECLQLFAKVHNFDFISRISNRLRRKDSNNCEQLRIMPLHKKVNKLGAASVTKHSKVYWRERVFRPVIKGAQVTNYCVQMSCEGIQRSLSLRTPNREEAAETARAWFTYLNTNGWAAFDAKYRSASSATITAPGSVKSYGVTVGDFLTAARNEKRSRPQDVR
jgi:hypothetical protein